MMCRGQNPGAASLISGCSYSQTLIQPQEFQEGHGEEKNDL